MPGRTLVVLGSAALLLGLLSGCGGSGAGSGTTVPSATSTALPPPSSTISSKAASRTPAQLALGLPPVAPGPVPGYVLIADRNNNRLLIVSPGKRVVWRFPTGALRPGQTFRDPDDAFFAPGYRSISTNEEFNDQIARIDIRTRSIVWTYGHAASSGSARGYLSNPDDAYELPNGSFMVADIRNCRVLTISPARQIVRSLGRAGDCTHDPPRTFSSPNGATPLPDGGVLVTEIGGWVDRISPSGALLWSIRTPTSYPSDAQLLPSGNILVAGFNTPGRVDILTPSGRVVWSYGPVSGPGSLDRPSLAVRWPNGMIAITDDWHHRVVVLDPRTKRIVWQYGHFGVASSANGYLSKPDGLDLLPASVAAVPARHVSAATALRVERIGSLPVAATKVSAVALPDGRLLVLGGLVGASSSDQILLGSPQHLVAVGHLPVAGHDAAAVSTGRSVLLFGGGQAVSTDAVVRIDPATGAAQPAGKLDEPLSDLGAATVGGHVYLVGGYTGSRYASAVLRVGPGTKTTTVARLPAGLRYAGVTALAGRIYVAGGITVNGTSAAVYAIDPAAGTVVRLGRLPQPLSHAPLVSVGDALYLVGGQDASGSPVATVLRIDPSTGAVASAGRLPAPLADAAAVALGGRAVVVGGAGQAAATRAVLALTPSPR